ncbi:MAG TPA: type 1 glutamine amidotransferase [Micrococcaceae bacterium]|jgi:GMP synthase (glutamine-hydrolysing)|nr:type 1 glutamine amidotransferase [Micrococcaceae bacterium]
MQQSNQQQSNQQKFMQKDVLILTHVPWEGPGLIADALAEAGIPYQVHTIVAEAEPQLPGLGEMAGVVIMGGPMDADDAANHPGLAVELQLVRDAIAAEVPVLGICLGHQIIALALGAPLHKGATQELGLSAVEVVSDDRLLSHLHGTPVLHWHRDNAGLPEGATLLARTAQCPNQAFRYGSAIGLQFHLELDEALLRAWLDDGGMAAELATAADAGDGRPTTTAAGQAATPATPAEQLLARFAVDQPVRSEAARHAFGLFALDAAARAATRPAV